MESVHGDIAQPIAGQAMACGPRVDGEGAIRIAVVDDHPIVRDALRRYLGAQQGLRVVADASSGRAAIDLVRTQAVDVLLLDIDMPDQSGMDALPMILAKSMAAHLKVLVFSGYPDDLYAVPFLRGGARGFLGKDCEPAEIVAAVRHVAAGGRWIAPAVAELLAEEAAGAPRRGAHRQLSPRELQIFVKLARGRTSGEVASELSLSTKTIATHRASVMRKLQARSNSDLTYYAVKQRLFG